MQRYEISNNQIVSDGYAIRFINCKDGKVAGNHAKVKTGNVLYFESGSTGNEITLNTLDASEGPDHGVVMFNGHDTRGNRVSKNTLIKKGKQPGAYVNWGGAKNDF
mgnify:CR=1 FL=1